MTEKQILWYAGIAVVWLALGLILFTQLVPVLTGQAALAQNLQNQLGISTAKNSIVPEKLAQGMQTDIQKLPVSERAKILVEKISKATSKDSGKIKTKIDGKTAGKKLPVRVPKKIAELNGNAQGVFKQTVQAKYPPEYLWNQRHKLTNFEFTEIARESHLFLPLLNTAVTQNPLVTYLCTNRQRDDLTRESDTDCGGMCSACTQGKACNAHEDCESRQCAGKIETGQRAITSGRCAGENAEELCTDTDVNNDVFTAGIVQDHGQTYEDQCKTREGSGALIQFSCTQGKVSQPEEKPCPLLNVCRNGKCVVNEQYCRRELDPEQDTRVRGQIVDITEQTHWDKCEIEGGNTVLQVECGNDGRTIWQSALCAGNEVCRQGICVPRDICTLPEVPNSTRQTFTSPNGENATHIDYCANENTVTHVLCTGNNENPSAGQTQCEPGQSCVNGTCGQEWEEHCIESDQGTNDPNNRDWARIGTDVFWDGCRNLRSTNETICIGNTVLHETGVCAQDKICREGRCRPLACQELTDWENNPEQEGSTLLIDGGENVFLDYCWVSKNVPPGQEEWANEQENREIVIQFLCVNRREQQLPESQEPQPGTLEWIDTDCPLGENSQSTYCINGTCQAFDHVPECNDSDNGLNIYEIGTVTSERDVNNLWTDFCAAEINGLWEFYCGNRGYVRQRWIDCRQEDPNRPFCNSWDGGKCSSCTDSDPWNNLDETGTIWYVQNGREQSHADICERENEIGGRVIQWQCSEQGQAVQLPAVACETWQICQNGHCVDSGQPPTGSGTASAGSSADSSQPPAGSGSAGSSGNANQAPAGSGTDENVPNE